MEVRGSESGELPLATMGHQSYGGGELRLATMGHQSYGGGELPLATMGIDAGLRDANQSKFPAGGGEGAVKGGLSPGGPEAAQAAPPRQAPPSPAKPRASLSRPPPSKKCSAPRSTAKVPKSPEIPTKNPFNGPLNVNKR